MFLTGFADEAGSSLDIQIKATKELGWKYIETRNIDGKNLSTLTDAEFDTLCEKLDNAGIAINCYGSSIANWGMHPRSKTCCDKRSEIRIAERSQAEIGKSLSDCFFRCGKVAYSAVGKSFKNN